MLILRSWISATFQKQNDCLFDGNTYQLTKTNVSQVICNYENYTTVRVAVY